MSAYQQAIRAFNGKPAPIHHHGFDTNVWYDHSTMRYHRSTDGHHSKDLLVLWPARGGSDMDNTFGVLEKEPLVCIGPDKMINRNSDGRQRVFSSLNGWRIYVDADIKGEICEIVQGGSSKRLTSDECMEITRNLINGSKGTNGLTPDAIDALDIHLCSIVERSLSYTGFALTPNPYNSRLQTQGFASTVSGLLTIRNTGKNAILAGQRLKISVPSCIPCSSRKDYPDQLGTTIGKVMPTIDAQQPDTLKLWASSKHNQSQIMKKVMAEFAHACGCEDIGTKDSKPCCDIYLGIVDEINEQANAFRLAEAYKDVGTEQQATRAALRQQMRGDINRLGWIYVKDSTIQPRSTLLKYTRNEIGFFNPAELISGDNIDEYPKVILPLNPFFKFSDASVCTRYCYSYKNLAKSILAGDYMQVATDASDASEVARATEEDKKAEMERKTVEFKMHRAAEINHLIESIVTLIDGTSTQDPDLSFFELKDGERQIKNEDTFTYMDYIKSQQPADEHYAVLIAWNESRDTPKSGGDLKNISNTISEILKELQRLYDEDDDQDSADSQLLKKITQKITKYKQLFDAAMVREYVPIDDEEEEDSKLTETDQLEAIQKIAHILHARNTTKNMQPEDPSGEILASQLLGNAANWKYHTVSAVSHTNEMLLSPYNRLADDLSIEYDKITADIVRTERPNRIAADTVNSGLDGPTTARKYNPVFVQLDNNNPPWTDNSIMKKFENCNFPVVFLGKTFDIPCMSVNRTCSASTLDGLWPWVNAWLFLGNEEASNHCFPRKCPNMRQHYANLHTRVRCAYNQKYEATDFGKASDFGMEGQTSLFASSDDSSKSDGSSESVLTYEQPLGFFHMTWNSYANLICSNTVRLSVFGVGICQEIQVQMCSDKANPYISGETNPQNNEIEGQAGTYGLGAYIRQVLSPADQKGISEATKFMREHSPIAKLVQSTVNATITAIGVYLAERNRKTIGHAVSSANSGEHVDVVLGTAT